MLLLPRVEEQPVPNVVPSLPTVRRHLLLKSSMKAMVPPCSFGKTRGVLSFVHQCDRHELDPPDKRLYIVLGSLVILFCCAATC